MNQSAPSMEPATGLATVHPLRTGYTSAQLEGMADAFLGPLWPKPDPNDALNQRFSRLVRLDADDSVELPAPTDEVDDVSDDEDDAIPNWALSPRSDELIERDAPVPTARISPHRFRAVLRQVLHLVTLDEMRITVTRFTRVAWMLEPFVELDEVAAIIADISDEFVDRRATHHARDALVVRINEAKNLPLRNEFRGDDIKYAEQQLRNFDAKRCSEYVERVQRMRDALVALMNELKPTHMRRPSCWRRRAPSQHTSI